MTPLQTLRKSVSNVLFKQIFAKFIKTIPRMHQQITPPPLTPGRGDTCHIVCNQFSKSSRWFWPRLVSLIAIDGSFTCNVKDYTARPLFIICIAKEWCSCGRHAGLGVWSDTGFGHISCMTPGKPQKHSLYLLLKEEHCNRQARKVLGIRTSSWPRPPQHFHLV